MRTEDGHLFTTNKLFPAIDTSKVKFEYTGLPVDLEAPAVRVKEKGKARKLEFQSAIVDPKHPADVLAKKLYDGDHSGNPNILLLWLCVSRRRCRLTTVTCKKVHIWGQSATFLRGVLPLVGCQA